MSRKISQTPWLVNGINKNVQSVQDSLCNILKEQTKCEEIKFGSSGREDVDVRMQLTGRPFFSRASKFQNCPVLGQETSKIQR